IYAQTSDSILELVEDTLGVVRAAPQHERTVVKVVTSDGDYWPLPWYLRSLQAVGWYDEVPPANEAAAPIMIVSATVKMNYDEKNDRGIFQLRPGVFFKLVVDQELWDAFVKNRR